MTNKVLKQEWCEYFVLAPRYATSKKFDEMQIGTKMMKFPFEPLGTIMNLITK